MKSLLLSLVMAVTFQAQAGSVELGKYSAIDAETKSIRANLNLRANGTVNFKVKTPDFTMPEPGCEGKYTVKGNQFNADMKCPTDLLPEASVQIDITNVNPQSVRTEKGAEVNVVIDALGSDPVKFLLKKAD